MIKHFDERPHCKGRIFHRGAVNVTPASQDSRAIKQATAVVLMPLFIPAYTTAVTQ